MKTNKKEEWAFIEGHPKYKISSHGRVMSFCKNKITILKNEISDRGYHRIGLDGKIFRVSRLVLAAFSDIKPFDKCHAAHLDGDKNNNSIDNLKWCTPRENLLHKIDHGTMRSDFSHYNSRLTKEQVNYIIRKYVRRNKSRSNSVYLAKQFGVSRVTITNIINGITYSNYTGIPPQTPQAVKFRKRRKL